MKVEKVFIQVNGELLDITDLIREQYEQFLAVMMEVRIAYEIAIREYDAEQALNN